VLAPRWQPHACSVSALTVQTPGWARMALWHDAWNGMNVGDARSLELFRPSMCHQTIYRVAPGFVTTRPEPERRARWSGVSVCSYSRVAVDDFGRFYWLHVAAIKDGNGPENSRIFGSCFSYFLIFYYLGNTVNGTIGYYGTRLRLDYNTIHFCIRWKNLVIFWIYPRFFFTLTHQSQSTV
jgi:hypothetical protein